MDNMSTRPYPSRDRALHQIARHRTPTLTPEQRRMAQGARKALALAGAATRPLMHAIQGAKVDVSQAAKPFSSLRRSA